MNTQTRPTAPAPSRTTRRPSPRFSPRPHRPRRPAPAVRSVVMGHIAGWVVVLIAAAFLARVVWAVWTAGRG